MEPLKVLVKYCFITQIKEQLLPEFQSFGGKKLWRNIFLIQCYNHSPHSKTRGRYFDIS